MKLARLFAFASVPFVFVGLVVSGCAAQSDDGEDEPKGDSTESAYSSCYSNPIYTSMSTSECKINTPGQSIPGRGLYICNTTMCIQNGRAVERGPRRGCHLVNCEVGTVCGDALC